MAAETMTSAERLAAAFAFEKPDRVPIVPLFVKSTALEICGVSQAEGERNPQLALDCMLKVYDDIGGWDAVYLDMPDTAKMQVLLWEQPMEWKTPGVDLPDDALLQVHEREAMTFDDYERVLDEGWMKFYYEDYIYRITDLERGSAQRWIKTFDTFYEESCAPEWQKRGVQGFSGALGGAMHPFFLLSLTRSFMKFTEDLYHHPKLIDRVLRRMTDEWIERSVAGAEKLQSTSVTFLEERASAYHYPLRVFERFWWPYTLEFVNAMWSRGIVTIMHLDTDWKKNLSYFKRDLKRGSYMLQMDNMTDMFAAKEYLQNHAMFHGDLPATMQAIGSVEDVRGYCRKLIDEVGYEGGFVLGTGCETAPNFKLENLRAMVETGKTYEFSKR